MNNVNSINEEEKKNIGNDKVPKGDNANSEYDENAKENEVVDFHLEFVDGESLYVCNICNNGLDTETQFTIKRVIINMKAS